jgi:hypothetical protein
LDTDVSEEFAASILLKNSLEKDVVKFCLMALSREAEENQETLSG